MSQVAHPTTAQRTQIPPAIRKFAISHCYRVESIDRFSAENEGTGRGWTIHAKSASLQHLPDDFEFGNVSHFAEKLTIQIRE